MSYQALKIKLKLINGVEHEITPINPDQIRWELERRKNNWPTQTDAPSLFTTVLAWNALKRNNLYSEPLEKFIDEVEHISAELVEIPPLHGATPGASA